MSDETTYDGYTNYETWLVARWLSGDPGRHDYWRHRARKARGGASEMAEMLKGEIEDGGPLNGAATYDVYADLLAAALAEVNWHELASFYISERVENEGASGE